MTRSSTCDVVLSWGAQCTPRVTPGIPIQPQEEETTKLNGDRGAEKASPREKTASMLEARTDQGMPEMNGPSLARACGQQEPGRVMQMSQRRSDVQIGGRVNYAT